MGASSGGGAVPGGAVHLSTAGPTGLQTNPLYYKGTEETQRFEAEWEQSKKRQDAQLERLERGVGSLADMARGMQEELDKQAPIIEDVDRQLHRVTSKLKSNNAKLKGLVLQVRPWARRLGEGCGRASWERSFVCIMGLALTRSLQTHTAPAKQMRSRRNFCIDIILAVVILGIIAYTVTLVQVRRRGGCETGGDARPRRARRTSSPRNRPSNTRNTCRRRRSRFRRVAWWWLFFSSRRLVQSIHHMRPRMIEDLCLCSCFFPPPFGCCPFACVKCNRAAGRLHSIPCV
jgi:hypothetical protein